MIKLENTRVVGWEAAIRGMRNPMNSWEKSDSLPCDILNELTDKNYKSRCAGCKNEFVGRLNCHIIGENDHDLMMRLAKGGPVHAKYRRMIVVYVDITAPLYWWKEFDTYKVGTVANSCSTMHKIAAKEFTLEDFSCEHLITSHDSDHYESDYCWHCESADIDLYAAPLDGLKVIIGLLNANRKAYLETKDKKYWWQMIQLLPSSYNQRRTVMLNYEVLAGIYPSRKDHKLDEWHIFCDWIEELPYGELITGTTASQRMLKIGEELHKGMEKGLENWKRENSKLYSYDTTLIDEWPNPETDKKDWPSSPEEVREALDEWDKIVEKIRNDDISSFEDLKKELGIESPSKVHRQSEE